MNILLFNEIGEKNHETFDEFNKVKSESNQVTTIF